MVERTDSHLTSLASLLRIIPDFVRERGGRCCRFFLSVSIVVEEINFQLLFPLGVFLFPRPRDDELGWQCVIRTSNVLYVRRRTWLMRNFARLIHCMALTYLEFPVFVELVSNVILDFGWHSVVFYFWRHEFQLTHAIFRLDGSWRRGWLGMIEGFTVSILKLIQTLRDISKQSGWLWH